MYPFDRSHVRNARSISVVFAWVHAMSTITQGMGRGSTFRSGVTVRGAGKDFIRLYLLVQRLDSGKRYDVSSSDVCGSESKTAPPYLSTGFDARR